VNFPLPLAPSRQGREKGQNSAINQIPPPRRERPGEGDWTLPLPLAPSRQGREEFLSLDGRG